MYISEDCIGFHTRWELDYDNENETFDDLDTTELARVILGIHYDFQVRTGNDPDGLRVLDCILEKISYYLDGGRWVCMDVATKRDRVFQVGLAKKLVVGSQLSLVEALCLLFTKTELGIYGI